MAPGLLTPVTELLRMNRAVEIVHLLLQVGLDVGNRLIVDNRSDFPHAIVQKESRLQVADLLVHVLGEVSLDGSDESLLDFLARYGDIRSAHPVTLHASMLPPEPGRAGPPHARDAV